MHTNHFYSSTFLAHARGSETVARSLARQTAAPVTIADIWRVLAALV